MLKRIIFLLKHVVNKSKDSEFCRHTVPFTQWVHNTDRPAQKPKGFSSFIFLFVKGRDYVRGGLSGGRFSWCSNGKGNSLHAEGSSKAGTYLYTCFLRRPQKFNKILTVDLTVCSTHCQIDGEDFVNFCGLLRKREL